MKFRMGFVSNSSTTSFCMYGIRWNIESQDIYDSFEDSCYKDLDFETGQDTDNVYVGLSIERMRDDETLMMFKERIRTLIINGLNKVDPTTDHFLSIQSIRLIQESCYNG